LFLLHKYITMHGSKNAKLTFVVGYFGYFQEFSRKIWHKLNRIADKSQEIWMVSLGSSFLLYIDDLVVGTSLTEGHANGFS
jgi:hypothetical protein